MDRSPFSLKARCYLIFFNLTILSAQPLMIYSLVWLLERYQSGRDLNIFFGLLFFLPLVWFVSSTILSIIPCKMAMHRYPVIEILSKESFNFLLSVVLLLLAIDIMTVAVIYFLGYVDTPELMGSIYAVGVFSNLIVLLSAFLIISYASIQIIQSKLYYYPCIIRVMK